MQVDNDCVEIYFEDLNEEAKRTLLEITGVKSPEEHNWDVFPIAVIPL